ncbi:GNAT family N-acetyltransferase [uncultured Roseibium sp.]|uniref:GNAT family N-acetyltransferase n=1 Tax=uncultured Roseibium sp. TaxID=1936171 RepID=UPI00261E9749|nr:GNAT family N-acetyltransferase [uncultured Roseibium sp.]
MSRRLRILDFAELNPAQVSFARSLEVSPAQVDFGGTFESSLDLIASEQSETLRGYCFLKDEEVVGLVVLKRPPSSPDWVEPGAVSLHALKIDRRWQGQGLGKEAFEQTVHAAATRWPDAKSLVLAVDAGNTAALAVYLSFGMTDSGPLYSGRIGKEHRLSLGISA